MLTLLGVFGMNVPYMECTGPLAHSPEISAVIDDVHLDEIDLNNTYMLRDTQASCQLYHRLF